MRRKGRLKNTPRKKEEYVGEPERDLRGIIQAQNMKINAAKWEHHLQERGLLSYCNAPCPED